MKHNKSLFQNKDSWLDVPATMTPVSLSLPKNLTRGQWAAIGPKIVRLHRFTTWALADWLNYGEIRYGETYSQYADATGLQPDYLAVVKHVGSRIDPTRRREELSFSHHRIVAALNPQAQTDWLSSAVDNGWSVEELRGALGESRDQIESSAGASDELIVRALRTEKALEWVDRWDKESDEFGCEDWEGKFRELTDRLDSIQARITAFIEICPDPQTPLPDLHERLSEGGRLLNELFLLLHEYSFQVMKFGRLAGPDVLFKNRCWVFHVPRGLLSSHIAHLIVDQLFFDWGEYGVP
jgi:hypothetical protein